MPTYDYECKTCGHGFERFRPITSKPSAVCPQCGKHARRLISSGAGIIFKGSGFYETDYKRKSSAAQPVQPAQEIPCATSKTGPSAACPEKCVSRDRASSASN